MVDILPFTTGHQGSPRQEVMSQMGLGMAIAVSMVVLSIFQRAVRGYLERLIRKLFKSMDPKVQIRFTEDSTDGGGPRNHEAYTAIETYLSAKCSGQAPILRANSVKDIGNPVLCVDVGEGVSDEFNGVKVRWSLVETNEKSVSFLGSTKTRYYALKFQKRNREIVVGEYLRHVMEEGKAVAARNRQLKLYSNSSDDDGDYWNYIMDFNHPAKFDTLAMEKEKKEDVIDDLIRFSTGREYYRRIGKPWKRGYLLHGPPGTGKSTMIAAMANLLSYDIYNLELTAVQSNAAFKRLMNRIPCNSILVIEDINCSSGITNQREENNQDEGARKTQQKVTLSELLNCIDGLFSGNDGGRVMVFTTNHVVFLDKALLRTGRMDKHIKMSYCGFEAFKILANNYLGIEDHELFGRIEELFKECSITPADVAENLIARSGIGEDSVEDCLNKLIQVLEEKKRKEEEDRDHVQKLMIQALEEMLRQEEERREEAESESESESEAGENGECK